MPELSNQGRRVFATRVGSKGQGVVRAVSERALPEEYRDRANKKAADAWIEERRARIERNKRNAQKS